MGRARLIPALAALLLPVIFTSPVRATDCTITFASDAGVRGVDPRVDGTIDPTQESYFLHIPDSYTGKEPYGLVVFVSPMQAYDSLPEGWAQLFDSRKMMVIIPQKAGNPEGVIRRYTLAVIAANGMLKHYSIDPNRVYSAGYAGGARIAGDLGFYESDIFRGTLQLCGSNFYYAVPKVDAKPLDTDKEIYGLIDASGSEIDAAKSSVRFALVTGPDDPRYGYMRDIYYGGFNHEGFHAKLFEVEARGHEIHDPDVLAAALNYIDPSFAPHPPTSRPSAPPANPSASAR